MISPPISPHGIKIRPKSAPNRRIIANNDQKQLLNTFGGFQGGKEDDEEIYRSNTVDLDVSKRFKYLVLGPINTTLSNDSGQFDGSSLDYEGLIGSQGENGDLIIYVEHCCNCDKHNTTLRHKAQKYEDISHTVLRWLGKKIHESEYSVRLGLLRVPYRRIGSCEIYALYVDDKGTRHHTRLHSKLNTLSWPNYQTVFDRLTVFLNDRACRPFTKCTINNGVYSELHPYPKAFGEWEHTSLSSIGWKYLDFHSPSEFQESGNQSGSLINIQYVYDSRVDWERENINMEIARKHDEKRRAEEEARRRAYEEAQRKTQEEERRRAEEEARKIAEAELRRKAAEDEVRRKAEEAARKKAEEEGRRKAEEEARLRAEEESNKKAEEARKRAEEEARKNAEDDARKKLEEEEARRLAEEDAKYVKIVFNKTEYKFEKTVSLTIRQIKEMLGKAVDVDAATIRLSYKDQDLKVKIGTVYCLYSDYSIPNGSILSATLPAPKVAIDYSKVAKDSHGNPIGVQNWVDGAFKGKKIVFIDLYDEYGYRCSGPGVIAALKKMGWDVKLYRTNPPSNAELKNSLADADQFWSTSMNRVLYNQEHVDDIYEFNKRGGALYLMGDNDPYNAAIMPIINKVLPGVKLFENYYGFKQIAAMKGGSGPGFIADHPIFTGIINLFEGDTIARFSGLNPRLKFIMNSSENKPALGICESHDGYGRVAVDTAFTRLMDKYFDSGVGQARFVGNISAWLSSPDADW